MAKPYLKLYKIKNENGENVIDTTTELDITTFIQDGGLNIEHEDLDNDKSGRNPDTGYMERVRIAKKHTITVKLRRIYSDDIKNIYLAMFDNNVKYPFFMATYCHPCHDTRLDTSHAVTFYCSSFNYGAQRYDRMKDDIFYDGATFKMIQK